MSLVAYAKLYPPVTVSAGGTERIPDSDYLPLSDSITSSKWYVVKVITNDGASATTKAKAS